MTTPERIGLNEFLQTIKDEIRRRDGLTETEQETMERAMAAAKERLGAEVEGLILITPTCVACGEAGEIHLNAEEAERYETLYVQQHWFIQDALPSLTPNQREQMITGTHPECFDRLFPEEEGWE